MLPNFGVDFIAFVVVFVDDMIVKYLGIGCYINVLYLCAMKHVTAVSVFCRGGQSMKYFTSVVSFTKWFVVSNTSLLY